MQSWVDHPEIPDEVKERQKRLRKEFKTGKPMTFNRSVEAMRPNDEVEVFDTIGVRNDNGDYRYFYAKTCLDEGDPTKGASHEYNIGIGALYVTAGVPGRYARYLGKGKQDEE